MPEAATAEEIEKVYLEGWKLGLKAIAIYRDNSKRSQPLSTGKKTGDTGADAIDSEEVEKLRRQLAKAAGRGRLPHRRRLPAERTAITHKFDIAGHEGYITVGLYPDGQPGEIFLKMAKEGSTVVGPDGHPGDDDLGGAPVRRAAQGPRQQVRPRPVRAVGLHRQPGDPDRQVDRGLHLPLARLAVPVATRTRSTSASRSASRKRARLPLRSLTAAGPRARRCPPPLSPLPSRSQLRSPRPRTSDAAEGDRVAADPVASPAPEPLAVIATNGALANGHAANGHGKPANGSSGGSTAPITLNLGATKVSFQTQADAPSCVDCGSIMVRNGSCYKCLNCGSTSGCS